VPDVVLYTTAHCGYCVAAKNLLKSRGANYREVRVDLDAEQRAEMLTKTRRTSVPQIFIDQTHVGGFEELIALDRAGGLKPLLENSP
jgi:glutaredoxin 3